MFDTGEDCYFCKYKADWLIGCPVNFDVSHHGLRIAQQLYLPY